MGIRIHGKEIADRLLKELKEKIVENKIKPHLEVLLVGDNPASLSFIRQKQKASEAIGATLHLTQCKSTISDEEFSTLLQQFNEDPKVSGIIIQRPLPHDSHISQTSIQRVAPEKDVDGFVPHSPFQVPVAKAVIKILEQIYYQSFDTPTLDFVTWIRGKDIVVIGKGETAGGPIKQTLEMLAVPVVVVDRSTHDRQQIFKKANIIISCAGVPNMITSHMIQEGVILISVGISKQNDTLVGDYDEEEIQDKASFYTPTPGGVGPVNVACLMQNLIEAASR